MSLRAALPALLPAACSGKRRIDGDTEIGGASNAPDDIRTMQGATSTLSLDELGSGSSGQCFDDGCDVN